MRVNPRWWMVKVAAIDCGTNSIRLLIAHVDQGGLQDVLRRMEIVRLGQDVDRTRQFHPEALGRTFAAAKKYASIIDHHDVDQVGFIATSATRDVDNREEFFSGIHSILGVWPEVISGRKEADLTFAGASRLLRPPHYPALVVDIGGGSTEFIFGSSRNGLKVHSVDIGSVRLTERFFPTGQTQGARIDEAEEYIDEVIADMGNLLPYDQVNTVVGTAGTITTVTAHVLGLQTYDSTQINGAVTPVKDTITACYDLLKRTRGEKQQLGFLHPKRVDVIGAGSLIWARILQAVSNHASGVPWRLLTSEYDILDGLALDLAQR